MAVPVAIGVAVATAPGPVLATQVSLDLRPIPALIARVHGHLVAVAITRLEVFPAPAGGAVASLPGLAIARRMVAPVASHAGACADRARLAVNVIGMVAVHDLARLVAAALRAHGYQDPPGAEL